MWSLLSSGNLSYSSFRVIIISIGIALICISGVAGHPIDTHKLWARSDEEISNNNANDTVASTSPDDLCYSLELDSNVTSAVQLMGQTTALFKLSDFYESWEVSMILDLKERFNNQGYNKANFVIVLPVPTDVENEDDNNSTLPTLSSDKANVTVIYETEDLEHLAMDSVTVIDSCGAVVYSIFTPWSSMQYPYVKAAILSAMFDQPCGTCEGGPSFDKNFRHPLFDKPSYTGNDIVLDLGSSGDKESRQAAGFDDLESTNNALNLTSSSSTLEPEPDASYLIPLRVIIPAEHVHRDSENPFAKFKKYYYYVLKTDNKSYHGHLDSDPPEIVGVWRDLEAGFLPLEEEQQQQDTTTTDQVTDVTTETTLITNSISDEPVFGFPGSKKYSFSTSNEIISTTTPVTTEVASSNHLISSSTPAPLDPLVYVNDQNKDRFRVRKKYRFGESFYSERNFDEVEFLREQLKTFITPLDDSGSNDNKNVRHVDEHYENILPWLDFVI